MEPETRESFYDSLFAEDFSKTTKIVTQQIEQSIREQPTFLTRNKNQHQMSNSDQWMDYRMMNGQDRPEQLSPDLSSSGRGSSGSTRSTNSVTNLNLSSSASSGSIEDQDCHSADSAFNDSLSDLSLDDIERFKHFSRNYTVKTLLILKMSLTQDVTSFSHKLERSWEHRAQIEHEREELLEKLSSMAALRENEEQIPEILQKQREYLLT